MEYRPNMTKWCHVLLVKIAYHHIPVETVKPCTKYEKARRQDSTVKLLQFNIFQSCMALYGVTSCAFHWVLRLPQTPHSAKERRETKAVEIKTLQRQQGPRVEMRLWWRVLWVSNLMRGCPLMSTKTSWHGSFCFWESVHSTSGKTSAAFHFALRIPWLVHL